MDLFLFQKLNQNSHFRPAAFLKVLVPHHSDVFRYPSTCITVPLEVSQLPLIQIIWVDTCLPTAEVSVIRKFLARYTLILN